MLNPISPGVLAVAAVISAPALWGAFEGTMDVDVALTRYLITVLVAWALLSIAKAYVIAARQETRRVLKEIAEEEAAAEAAVGASAIHAATPSSSMSPASGSSQSHDSAGAA
jgi:hypothetical protein